MASRKISELVACTVPSSNDFVVLVANSGSNTEKCSIQNFFNNSAANVTVNVARANQIFAVNSNTPSTSTDTVPKGRIWYDGNYLYIAIADDTIRRITLETF